MNEPRILCNVCRRMVWQFDHTWLNCLCLSVDATGQFKQEHDNPRQAEIHICGSCLIGLREFLDAGLILNLIGEPVCPPQPLPELPSTTAT